MKQKLLLLQILYTCMLLVLIHLPDQAYTQPCESSYSFLGAKIPTDANGLTSSSTADMDGDGDLDIVANAFWDNEILWFENDGEGWFTEHLLAANITHAVFVEAKDMDGDGDMDVLAALFNDQEIVWLENAGDGRFFEKTIANTVDGAVSLQIFDMDKDGDLDVVSASQFDNKIAWHENIGEQRFEERIVSTAALGATSVFVADINLDGNLDIISTSYDDNKISWYENNGSSNFTERVITTIALGAVAVSAMDMNGDGEIDIISASKEDNTIAVYENRGDEQFRKVEVDTEAGGVSSLMTTDIDADGLVDILVGADEENGQMFLYRNLGGSFEKIPVAMSIDGIWSINAADMDEDGDMDLISTSYSQISWLDNSRQLAETIISDKIQSPDGVFVADVNGDGTKDILAAGSSFTHKLAWYDMSGGEPFTEHVIDNPSGAGSVTAADFDKDGDIDVVCGHWLGLAWYENTGLGQFVKHNLPMPTNAFNQVHVHLSDLDKDAHPDFLAYSHVSNRIAWHKYDHNGGFTIQFIDASPADISSVFIVDMDKDQDSDILISSSENSTIAWLENDGNGQFSDHVISDSIRFIRDATAVDLDRDGDLDVLSTPDFRGNIYWFENNGSFQFTQNFLGHTGNGGRRIKGVDMDLDGDVDVLTISGWEDAVSLFENDGNLNFRERNLSFGDYSPEDFHIEDINDDGIPDIVLAFYTPGGGKVSLYLNDIDKDDDGLIDSEDNCNKLPNTSLSFDGADDYISIPNPKDIPLQNSSYTIEAWFYANSMGDKGIVGWGPYWTNSGVNALRLSGNGIRHYWWANDLDATTGDITGEWHHLAATYNGTHRILYLDGQEIVRDQPGSHLVPNADNLTIGKTFDQEFFDGKIDEVRIWNVARSQAEIVIFMNEELRGSESGLVGYYRFNEGSVGEDNTALTQLTDFSEKDNAGNLENFDASGCVSNWSTGAPVQFADLNNNGIGDACEQAATPIEGMIAHEAFFINQLFPNPAQDEVYLNFHLLKREVVQLEIINLYGQRSKQKSIDAQAGENAIGLNISHLSPGTYFVRLTRTNGSFDVKSLIVY